MTNPNCTPRTRRLKSNVLALILAVLPLWCIPACADEWTTADTHRELVYAALVAVDWRQTQDIARHPEIEEYNEVLGEHPSNGQINRYFIVSTAMQFAIAYALPSDWRRTWQDLGIGFELAFVLNNWEAGLRVDF